MKQIMPNKAIKSAAISNMSFEELISVYKFFSRWAAVLPFEGRNFDFIGTRILTVVFVVNTIVDLGMFFGYDIDAFIHRRSIKIEDVYIPLMAIGAFSRYYTLLWYRKNFAAIFEECGHLWDFCNAKGQATVKAYERKIRSVYRISAFSFFTTNIALPINAYMARLPPSEPNATEQRVLPVRFFVEDEPEKFLGYHATFIIQSIVIQNCCIIGLVHDGILPGLIMLSAGYFHQLKDRLLDCCEYDPLIQNEEIMRCIKFHQRLLKHCEKFNNLSQGMLLIQVIVSCYTVSLILIKLTGSDPDKYSHIPVIGIYVCQLFLINWTPDLLADQSEKVSFAAYYILMKRLDDKKHLRNLHILLLMAQTPIITRAGGFITLSLENYGLMMKKAFSFFMVLRTLGI